MRLQVVASHLGAPGTPAPEPTGPRGPEGTSRRPGLAARASYRRVGIRGAATEAQRAGTENRRLFFPELLRACAERDGDRRSSSIAGRRPPPSSRRLAATSQRLNDRRPPAALPRRLRSTEEPGSAARWGWRRRRRRRGDLRGLGPWCVTLAAASSSRRAAPPRPDAPAPPPGCHSTPPEPGQARGTKTLRYAPPHWSAWKAPPPAPSLGTESLGGGGDRRPCCHDNRCLGPGRPAHLLIVPRAQVDGAVAKFCCCGCTRSCVARTEEKSSQLLLQLQKLCPRRAVGKVTNAQRPTPCPSDLGDPSPSVQPGFQIL